MRPDKHRESNAKRPDQDPKNMVDVKSILDGIGGDRTRDNLRNVMQIYRCCDDLAETLDKMYYGEKWALMLDAEIRAAKLLERHGKIKYSSTGPPPEPKIKEPHELRTIVGLCPRCGKTLMGAEIHDQPCKVGKGGSKMGSRVFYKECSKCTYIAEVFIDRRTKKVTETEGG